MIRATVIADASFCPRTRAGGWAVWIVVAPPGGWGWKDRIKRYGTFHRNPPNSTVAERWALFNGIWLAYKAGARDILAQTDCLGVIEDYPNSAETIAKHWPDAVVTLRHVKGHTAGATAREWVNNWCDEMARAEMRKVRHEQPRRETPARGRPGSGRPPRAIRA